MAYYDEVDISILVGKTLTKIDGGEGTDELVFTTSDGDKYKMYHCQDCCEDVSIEDIVGDLIDLLNTPILEASVRTNNDSLKSPYGSEDESSTWTFYRISTIHGTVVIRWYGSSNGYYSEEVNFEKLEN